MTGNARDRRRGNRASDGLLLAVVQALLPRNWEQFPEATIIVKRVERALSRPARQRLEQWLAEYAKGGEARG